MIGVMKAEDIYSDDAYQFYVDIVKQCLSHRLSDETYTPRNVVKELVNMQCALHQVAIVVEEKTVTSKEKLEYNMRETYRMFKYYLDKGFDIEEESVLNSEADDLRELIRAALSDKTFN